MPVGTPHYKRWFNYNGTGDVSLPSSYIDSSANPSCINGFHLCTIYAIYTKIGQPSVITAKLQGYIASVLSTGLAQPQGVVIPVKPFAYGKA